MRMVSGELEPDRVELVEKHARQLLVNASGLGRLPTPVRRIISMAGVEVVDTIAFDELSLADLRECVADGDERGKRVSDKVVGILDCRDRVAYVDSQAHKAKKPFVMLHETGHDQLPWQREMFKWLEESEFTLNSAVKEQFEQEANVFASAVLFQCDVFSELAEGLPFGIDAPLKLAKRFGGSFYATLWRYVSRHNLSCGVLVFDKSECRHGVQRFPLRRSACSPSFARQFGGVDWPEFVDATHPVAGAIPVGNRKMIKDYVISLRDSNGIERSLLCESFTNGFQMFVLMLVL